MRSLNAKTCLVEIKYIDKNYLIDYQKYYSRSYTDYSRHTERIHFFTHEFTSNEFTEAIEGDIVDTEFIKILRSNYLGFTILTPIQNREDQPIIGRTLLSTFPETEGEINRYYLKNKHDAHLFGIKLSVDSIPYQVQDRRVSACATVSLWTALNTIAEHFDTPKYSPVEITEIATQTPSLGRIFPQIGLTATQIIRFFQTLGFDTQPIKTDKQQNDEMITTAVRAYLEFGLPIIAGFRILDFERACDDQLIDVHAVVITGYQYDADGEISELYVHDDQVGPYCKVEPDGDFRKWRYEWNQHNDHKLEVFMLFIPVYHKIRTDFIEQYSIYQEINNSELPEGLPENTKRRLLLVSQNTYKSSILNQPIENKFDIMTAHLPRFLWIIRTQHGSVIFKDDLFDGTAAYPKKIISVLYDVQSE